MRSVEEYDAHKNQWYALKATNFAHRYYAAVSVYNDLNPVINSGYGVLVCAGNDGRLYGDEYVRNQQLLRRQKSQMSQAPEVDVLGQSASGVASLAQQQAAVNDDWGFIEFYDPRDWIRKWTVIDSLPRFLGLSVD